MDQGSIAKAVAPMQLKMRFPCLFRVVSCHPLMDWSSIPVTPHCSSSSNRSSTGDQRVLEHKYERVNSNLSVYLPCRHRLRAVLSTQRTAYLDDVLSQICRHLKHLVDFDLAPVLRNDCSRYPARRKCFEVLEDGRFTIIDWSIHCLFQTMLKRETQSQSSSDDPPMSNVQVTGIAIGVGLGAVLILWLGYKFWWKPRKARKESAKSQETG
jgi:hypothetical protein